MRKARKHHNMVYRLLASLILALDRPPASIRRGDLAFWALAGSLGFMTGVGGMSLARRVL